MSQDEDIRHDERVAGPEQIIRFWFDELTPDDWFRKSTALDRRIAERFGPALDAARTGATAGWRGDYAGRLAEILVLDQFTRNIHRDSPRAFENDPAALALARLALAAGADRALCRQKRAFVYMPLMHSEEAADQQTAVTLYEALGLAGHLDAARKHAAIIERFGRFPHRNAVLGRTSTAEEQAFLAEPGSSF